MEVFSQRGRHCRLQLPSTAASSAIRLCPPSRAFCNLEEIPKKEYSLDDILLGQMDTLRPETTESWESEPLLQRESGCFYFSVCLGKCAVEEIPPICPYCAFLYLSLEPHPDLLNHQCTFHVLGKYTIHMRPPETTQKDLLGILVGRKMSSRRPSCRHTSGRVILLLTVRLSWLSASCLC